MDLEKEIFDDAEEALPDEFAGMSADDILRRNRLLDNEIRVLKDESQRLTLDQQTMKEKVKENKEKIKLNNQLPYLVGNVVEILDIKPEEEDEEDGANIDLDSQRKGKCVVLKTSTRLVLTDLRAALLKVDVSSVGAEHLHTEQLCHSTALHSQANHSPACCGLRRCSCPKAW